MTQAIEAFERKPQKITALRVTAERAVEPGEWIVVTGNRQEIYSEAEFAEEFTPARSAPRKPSSYRPARARRTNGNFARAMRAFSGAIKAVAADQKETPEEYRRRLNESIKKGVKMRPYAAGVTIAKLVDSGLVDDVLPGQSRTNKINYGCNVAKALFDRGILTRERIETVDTADRPTVQFHYFAA